MIFNDNSLEILREEAEGGYIYGLFNKDHELLYIGQTTSIFTRTNTHFKEKKDVEYCKYKQVPIDLLSEYEATYILEYLPIYNNTIPPNEWFYTLDQYQKNDTRFYSRRVEVLRLVQNIKNYNGYYKIEDLQKISKTLDIRG